MDPLLPLTLYWRGLRKPLTLAWDLLGLTPDKIFGYLAERDIHIPENWIELGEAEISACRQNNFKIVPFWDPHYPLIFRELHRPPWVISVLGHSESLIQPGLAVVGSRQPHFSSLRWMDLEYSQFIKKRNWITLSGGARGVDQKAHMIAFRENQPTVGFLPSGLLKFYPANLMQWKSEFLRTGGGIVSVYSPFASMQKHHFIERNDLIAALGRFTFIVEARRRSGTLLTATRARELGRDVAVLPSFPGDAGMGGLDVLANGGVLIRDWEDLYALSERN